MSWTILTTTLVNWVTKDLSNILNFLCLNFFCLKCIFITTGYSPFLRPVRVGLRLRGGHRRGRGPVAACSRQCGSAWRSCDGAGPLPRAGAQLPVDCVLLLGGWLVLMRGYDACRAVGGGLQSEAALIDVRLAVGSLPPRSSSPTVAGCRLGGFLLDVIGGVESALWEGCYPA